MNLITGSINLTAFKSVIMEANGKNGKVKGIFIPFEANDLEVHKKGNVYLNIVAFEAKNEYSTHIVKQSLPKEVREKRSKEELYEMPIIGNLSAENGHQDVNNASGSIEKPINENEDLPF